MVVGFLRIELHLPQALSLKDKRSILKSVKDRAHGRFNVAMAEVDANEKWQRATLGVAAVGSDRRSVERHLTQVVEWLQANRFLELIRVEQEYL